MKRIKLYGRLSTRKSDSLAAYYELLGGIVFVAVTMPVLFGLAFGEAGISVALTIILATIGIASVFVCYRIIIHIVGIIKRL